MKTVVLFSGGLDSAVVLARCIQEGEVLALTFDYEQSNRAEVEAAEEIASLWGFPHRVIPINLKRRDARFEIPARNTIFLSFALEIALSEGCDTVAYGAEPDATYCDSSVPYIQAMQEVFKLHGVSLLAPVKDLADKEEVLKSAFELGVPIHLVHSSRTNSRIGCGTSARLLKALQSIFPNVNPLQLLDYLKDAHLSNPFDLRTRETGSFKFWPALFALSWALRQETPYRIWTTGNWGRSLNEVNDMLGGVVKLDIMHTGKEQTKLLGKSDLSTGDRIAQWGMKQALSHLPRPRYLNAALSFPVIQGHLLQAVESLGYTFDTNGIKLLTGAEYA